MNNKLVIAIAALMVAALAAPAVIADVTYTATVVTSDVSVEIIDANFGDLLAGTSKLISPSLNLTNSGGAAANVTAEFTTFYGSTTYGMPLNTTVGIPAASVKIDGQTMSNLGDPVSLNQVPAHSGGTDGQVFYSAELTVPPGQAAGIYSGNVLLIFTAV